MSSANDQNKVNRKSKRTRLLKTILKQQDCVPKLHQEMNENNHPNTDLTSPNLPESEKNLASENLHQTEVLPIAEINQTTSLSPKNALTTLSTPSTPIAGFSMLVNREIANAAKLLEIDEGGLQTWLNLQVGVPDRTILHLLRTMQNLCLDPLNEELTLAQLEDESWQVVISVDGCAKLLNQHPQFNGLVFHQADTLIDGVPEWMECSIYRRDRITPITVREYLIEVRKDQAIWQTMPRRMLRHRVLQQCVRLAVT